MHKKGSRGAHAGKKSSTTTNQGSYLAVWKDHQKGGAAAKAAAKAAAEAAAEDLLLPPLLDSPDAGEAGEAQGRTRSTRLKQNRPFAGLHSSCCVIPLSTGC